MFTLLLWISAGLWLLVTAQVIINCRVARNLAKVNLPDPDQWPTVSIVVPARNEQHAIREAVSSFCRLDYPHLEVIVVDDCSTDATPDILAELAAEFPRLRVIRGSHPPPGWLGKTHALQCGVQQATGQWLLFVDADVIFAPDVLRRAIAHALQQRAHMLFLMPRLVTEGVLEAVIMSSIYIVAFGCVPFFLVHRPGWKRFAIGGGCFNLVRRDAFDASGAFESLKDAVIDDVALGRRVKAATRPDLAAGHQDMAGGHRLCVARAASLIRVRMYDGARSAIRGFSKNAYSAAGRRPGLLPAPILLGALLSVLPYAGLLHGLWNGTLNLPALIALTCMHLSLGILAILFRQPWYIALLNPLREVSWWWILCHSAILYRRTGLTWRGRTYDLDSSQPHNNRQSVP